MKLKDKSFFNIPPKIREYLFFFNFIKHPIIKLRNIIELKHLYKNYNEEFGMYKKQKKIIYKTLKRLTLKTNDGFELSREFYTNKIEIIKQSKIEKNNIILICLVKNDLKRIKEFYKHYKKIGVSNFVFIDNNSTDGTLEYLISQENTTVFQVYEKYSTIKRQAWISRIMSYYGYNNWFLIVDSDEFLVYNECEKRKINELIDKLRLEKKVRARALMIDMYSNDIFLQNSLNNDNFIEKYCYFDNNTYYIKNHKCFELVTGGMRNRVFGKYGEINPFLIKYPIIYYEKGDFQYNSHFSYPFYKNFNIGLNLALLHYKFLPEDLEKIKNRVKEKNYASGSAEYNAYLKAYNENKNLTLRDEKSIKYRNSKDLTKINIIKPFEW